MDVLSPVDRRELVSLVEPASLVDAFVQHPPLGFQAEFTPDGMPTFVAPFDLLTTADDPVRRAVQNLPLHAHWGRLLTWRTRFVGCTVTEYAPLASGVPPERLVSGLLSRYGQECPLLIVKDLAVDSPLLDVQANACVRAFTDALQAAGFVLLDGMSLAWVPLDVAAVEEHVARLSANARSNVRRKLKSRSQLRIDVVPAGSAWFDDDAVVAGLYRLYVNVYEQSAVHFDLLQEAFFRKVLRDPGNGGVLFVYRHDGEVIGWKLCFEHGGMLLDKYVGFSYPQSRDHNLYVVSWFHCIEYALSRGLTHMVDGWTDARIKRYLGARITRTRHAVHARNRLVHAVLRRMAGHFENEPG
ncbi:MAG: hypothetical protein RLZZ393_909 [Pseudomonadota bacterium]|jgi:hypothetical protein